MAKINIQFIWKLLCPTSVMDTGHQYVHTNVICHLASSPWSRP